MPATASHPPILTVPGLGGSGAGHWQTAWEQLLPAGRVEQRNWDAPRYPAWAASLSAAVAAVPRPTVLVGHSLGCILIARWLGAHPTAAVAGALLVAPADLDWIAHDPRFDIEGFDPVPRARLPVPSALVASRNDPYLDLERGRAFARDWGSRFHDAGALGHINAASDLGDWPDGLAVLRTFLAELAGRAPGPGA